ncbi:MAG: amidase [Candidatus Puniceispirillales bacterium]
MQPLSPPLDAARLVSGIGRQQISIDTVIKESLARCETVQQALNPFTAIYTEEALAKADKAQERLNSGKPVRLLEGVPVAIKEFTPIKGKPTSRGSAALKGHIADQQPVIVRRLEEAGAIIVARTTTPEFAHSSFTRSPLQGHTRNPFDPSRTCGGSSGGSAVAVATGCVALAEGTDMGGSVRIPAALCGVAGFKPSLGRIPMDILPTVFDTISHFGPLGRSMTDIRLFMDAVSGPDDADILSQPTPVPLETAAVDPARLNLAVSPDLGFFAVDPEVAANFDRCVNSLADAGARITPVDLGWSAEIVDAWYDYWCVYLAAAAEDLLEDHRPAMDPEFLTLVDRGLAMSAVAFRRLDEIRTRQWHQFAAAMQGYDALLCPTMALPAPPLEARESDYTTVAADGRLHGLDMTCVFNSIGQCPALSVPSGVTASGLPTAVQIIGQRFDDNTVLKIGQSLESLCGWQAALQPVMDRFTPNTKPIAS